MISPLEKLTGSAMIAARYALLSSSGVAFDMFRSGVGGLAVAPAPVGVLFVEIIPDLSNDWKRDETSGTAGAAFGNGTGGVGI